MFFNVEKVIGLYEEFKKRDPVFFKKLLLGFPKDVSSIDHKDLIEYRMQRAFEAGLEYGANEHKKETIKVLLTYIP